MNPFQEFIKQCILQHSPWVMIICHPRVMFMPAFYSAQQTAIKVCDWSTAVIKQAFFPPTLSIFSYNRVWSISKIPCAVAFHPIMWKQKYLTDTLAFTHFIRTFFKVLVEYILRVRFSSLYFSNLKLCFAQTSHIDLLYSRGQKYLSRYLLRG